MLGAFVLGLYFVWWLFAISCNVWLYYVMHAPEYGGPLAHQIRKLSSPVQFDTVFVGDSSLGNAIRPEAFDRIAGTRSINLALSGNYGYGGPFNMIRRAIETRPVRNVVVMMAADSLNRPMVYDGFVFTAPNPWAPHIPLSDAAEILKTFLRRVVVESYGASGLLDEWFKPDRPGIDPRTDYPTQRGKTSSLYPPSVVQSIETRHLVFVRAIVSLCKARSLNCLFVHGPWFGKTIRDNANYTAKVNGILREAGAEIIGETPLALSADELGDGIDHVSPEKIDIVSERYAAMLAGRL